MSESILFFGIGTQQIYKATLIKVKTQFSTGIRVNFIQHQCLGNIIEMQRQVRKNLFRFISAKIGGQLERIYVIG